MQTITISKNKLIIGVLLIVALLVGGAIGFAMGEHGGREDHNFKYEGRYGQGGEMNSENTNDPQDRPAAQDSSMSGATSTINVNATGTIPRGK